MARVSYVVVGIVALVVAGLTLVSGFGLGTLLMPVFALFFPVEVAIAATAVAHLVNNVVKLGLVGRWAVWRVVWRFGGPAMAAAFVGAGALAWLGEMPVIARYGVGGRVFEATPVKVVIGVLIAGFVVVEWAARVKRARVSERWLPVGGAVSGFFGGLSGHQGALRMVFLARCGLTKEEIVGTSAVCAVIVDVARLVVYGAAGASARFGGAFEREALPLVGVACAGAAVGSIVGARVIEKVTLETVQRVIGVMLLVTAGLLVAGVI
ncbi:MAG: TSUP family transporter [Phycisphaerales bacterium]